MLFSFSVNAEIFKCDGVKIDVETALDMSEEVIDLFDGQRLQKNLVESLTEIEKIKWAEEIAIKLYTDQTYKKINPDLRLGVMPLGYRNFVYTLCSALTKLPKYVGSVKRISVLPIEVQNTFVEGDIITQQAFWSTSANSDGIKAFRNNTNKKYNTIYYIESLTGRDVTQFSAWPGEKEILFPAGAKFMVTETFRPYFSNMKYVWLREVE